MPLRTDNQAYCTLAPILHLPRRLGEHVVALGPPSGKPLLASQRVRPGPFADQERVAGTVGVL
jgi:hypothetical protein